MAQQNERVYVRGIFGKAPHHKAPAFVLGKGSINVKEFIEYLQSDEAKQYFNDYNGTTYFNFDILRTKDGEKLSFVVNTYKADGGTNSVASKPAKKATKDSGDGIYDEGGSDDLPF